MSSLNYLHPRRKKEISTQRKLSQVSQHNLPIQVNWYDFHSSRDHLFFLFTDSLKNHSLSHVNHEKKYERHCPTPFQEQPRVWVGIKQLIYVWIKETPSILAALAEGASGTATAGESWSQISPKLFSVNLLLTEQEHLERASCIIRLGKKCLC